MFSLSVAPRFHKGEVTPVVTDVSEFMETLLNDCSGESLDDNSDFPTDPKEMSFLVLKVLIIIQASKCQVRKSGSGGQSPKLILFF